MIHRHLMWKQGPDNLVSWTSSLPFALVYMFHLHANARDGSDFEDIQLCIVDTTCLPRGIFVRDLDLIRAYSSHDVDLAETEKLRTLRQGGRFYFGEYLSQGALKIEGGCDIVSASALWVRFKIPSTHGSWCSCRDRMTLMSTNAPNLACTQDRIN